MVVVWISPKKRENSLDVFTGWDRCADTPQKKAFKHKMKVAILTFSEPDQSNYGDPFVTGTKSAVLGRSDVSSCHRTKDENNEVSNGSVHNVSRHLGPYN